MPLPDLMVDGGVEENVGLVYSGPFSYLDMEGNNPDNVEKLLHLPGSASAPVAAGQKAGEAVYRLNGRTIGCVDILYENDVRQAVYRDYLRRLLVHFLL